MGETANIAEVANRVSEDIFKWFKWEKIPLMDEGFPCVKSDKHSKAGRDHEHPVDVVFKYFDTYLNRYIYLNTDLKSYAKNSINTSRVKEALQSLAKTIDCARVSDKWRAKYVHDCPSYEIRGMLFIYNHDGEYHKEFGEKILGNIKVDSLGIEEGQYIHVVEPKLIRYLSTVTADMKHLHHNGELPEKDYNFFYPDQYLHKTHGSEKQRSCTLENMGSPYFIIQHGVVKKYDEDSGGLVERHGGGYVIYYNRKGDTDYEFLYLIDALSRFQIINSGQPVRIRVAHEAPSEELKSNFQSAKLKYAREWDFDEYKRNQLENITIDIVSEKLPNYMPGILGWK